MDDAAQSGMEDALAAAQATIARQAAELERLRHVRPDEQFAATLRQALTLAAAAGMIAAPVTHTRLLELIVETAAHVIGAQAAALFLIDEAAQELVFEVALGQKAAEVKQFRVPLGHGIAGLVAVSGQPIATSDAQRDPRQAADIARSVGYAPQSILCVPLFFNDHVTGVLELLDKAGAPSFSARDMEVLGLFANQAAIAIEQSRTRHQLVSVLNDVLQPMLGTSPEAPQHLHVEAAAFTDYLETDERYRRAVALARLVQEIAQQGEHEFAACQTILRGFAEYLRSRTALGSELGAWG